MPAELREDPGVEVCLSGSEHVGGEGKGGEREGDGQKANENQWGRFKLGRRNEEGTYESRDEMSTALKKFLGIRPEM